VYPLGSSLVVPSLFEESHRAQTLLTAFPMVKGGAVATKTMMLM
jgi:hypothetical protein